MANFFDSVIEDLKKANGGNEDEVITALRAKRDELGNDASKSDVMSAVRSCLMAPLKRSISLHSFLAHVVQIFHGLIGVICSYLLINCLKKLSHNTAKRTKNA